MPEPVNSRVVLHGSQALLGIAILATWQELVNAHVLDKFFFSRPTDIAARIVSWVRTGFIWPHLVVTLEEAALAFALGSAAGMIFGFGLARAPRLGRLVDPYIRLLNALPRVVLAPIFLLWFGLGIWSKVALGITVVDPVIINNARMLGASEWQLVRHVLLPSALTWVFSSLHISIGFAMIAVVVGEYLGAARGVGYLISQAEGTFDTTGVFAGMAVLSAVVLVVGWGVDRLERRLLRWKV
jgi:NitT/TauT family transport system permease protein